MPASHGPFRRNRGRFRSVGTHDECKPNNPNIPFFATYPEYMNRSLPALPAGADSDRREVRLVEPGAYSIEVYEAIISRSEGSCQPLEKYICESGVVQIGRRRNPYVPASAAADVRRREERDICFTLVSWSEKLQINDWMSRYEVYALPNPKLATPFGGATARIPLDEQAAFNICESLGFGMDDSEYPRSALPPGVIPVKNKGLWEWALPGADGIPRDGRATDDCGFHRIEWPSRRND